MCIKHEEITMDVTHVILFEIWHGCICGICKRKPNVWMLLCVGVKGKQLNANASLHYAWTRDGNIRLCDGMNIYVEHICLDTCSMKSIHVYFLKKKIQFYAWSLLTILDFVVKSGDCRNVIGLFGTLFVFFCGGNNYLILCWISKPAI